MKKITVLVTALILMLSTSAIAKSYKMVFWYPGEAGSAADAQPLLDEFFEYIAAKDSTLKITGKYFNKTEDGLKYIKSANPDFGIVSFISLSQSDLANAKKIASTLPLPTGTTKEQFYLVGGKDETKTTQKTIISSLPIKVAFYRKNMAPDCGCGVKITEDKNLFSSLKKIATGELKVVALLTPMEKYTLDNIKVAWTKNLKVLKETEKISSAPVVSFGDKGDASAKFVKVLKEMSKDPEGKEILESLRLKGFAN